MPLYEFTLHGNSLIGSIPFSTLDPPEADSMVDVQTIFYTERMKFHMRSQLSAQATAVEDYIRYRTFDGKSETSIAI